MEELRQNDIFVEAKKAERIVEKERSVPTGYIPVAFSSGNKLGPEILHFRNYSMEELFELASVKQELQFKTLVYKALNNMVYEDFDCGKLHYENIKEIVVAIYKNFWGNILYNRPYFVDLSDLEKKDNVAYTDINLSFLKTIDINEKFKNKISLTDKVSNKKIVFQLPKIEHMFLAEEAVKNKYAEKEREYFDIKNLMDLKDKLLMEKEIESVKSIEIDPIRKEEYDDIIKEKSKDYYKIIQAQLIYSIEDKVLNSIEEKMNAYKSDIDANAWIEYKNIVEEYGKFGINPEYEFTLDGKKLSRRFSFRPLIFIPTMDKKSNPRYNFQFDDWV